MYAIETSIFDLTDSGARLDILESGLSYFLLQKSKNLRLKTMQENYEDLNIFFLHGKDS